MNDYVLSCCSTTDLDEQYFIERNIKYLCYSYTLNGTTYIDDLGKSMPLEQFYNALANGGKSFTSQINMNQYIDYFTPFLQQGKDVFHLSFSSGLSGSYQSALLAQEQLKKQFPDRKLIIIDSLCASSGYGLLIDFLADLKESGTTIDELAKMAIKHRLQVNHLFFSTDLTFYIRGGRVSKTAGFIGNLLNICPILKMNDEGKLILKSKARGKKNAMKRIATWMEELAIDNNNYCQKCFISHSNCYDDAVALANLISTLFPKIKGAIKINNIGTTIGSHTGIGTVALFFFGTSRK